MDLSKQTLNDRDTDMIITGWEAMKPKAPHQPEPLFVWPRLFGPRYIIRLYLWRRKMKKTHWAFFHQRYQQWSVMINEHYNALSGSQDYRQNPHLMRLRRYQSNADKMRRENTMSQAEFDRRKRSTT